MYNNGCPDPEHATLEADKELFEKRWCDALEESEKLQDRINKLEDDLNDSVMKNRELRDRLDAALSIIRESSETCGELLRMMNREV